MKKDAVLATLSKLLIEKKEDILDANKRDIAACENIGESLLDRLKINENKILGMLGAVKKTQELHDPEGRILLTYQHENGMKIENRSVPFGKILIIYESRPDVTIEASVLAFKAGNKVLLKGGKESRETNKVLVSLWHEALLENGMSTDFVTYLDTSREETQNLIRNNTHNVDLIIPRGGEGLINFVKQNTDIPLIVSGRGNNFLYIDKESDFDMAIKIVINGKQRISVCNALDKVLIHKDLPDFSIKMEQLIKELKAHNIEGLQRKDVGDEVLKEEFLSAKILLSEVENADEAIELINTYSGGHSATIISSNVQTAERFQAEVDCAAVYHNVSTRFTDGGQFGFGAEIAISTQKLHARGPIGLDQLVTNKWFISGNGQIRT